jgi:hypothetical protein
MAHPGGPITGKRPRERRPQGALPHAPQHRQRTLSQRAPDIYISSLQLSTSKHTCLRICVCSATLSVYRGSEQSHRHRLITLPYACSLPVHPSAAPPCASRVPGAKYFFDILSVPTFLVPKCRHRRRLTNCSYCTATPRTRRFLRVPPRLFHGRAWHRLCSPSSTHTPRHGLQFNSRDEGSKCESMRWHRLCSPSPCTRHWMPFNSTDEVRVACRRGGDRSNTS